MKAGIATLFALVLTVAPSARADEEITPARYEVSVDNGAVTAHVEAGSLIALVEDLGYRFGFEVIAHNVKDVPVKVDFEGQPLDTALRLICQKIGYVAVPDPVTGKTVRLVLTPSRSVAANRVASRRDPLPRVHEPEDDPFATPADEEPADTPPADDTDS